MIRSRYTIAFAGAAVALTLAAVGSYREISAMAWSAAPALDTSAWAGYSRSAVTTPVAAPSYDELFARDDAWRHQNARVYSIAELRARGDGRRTAREAMEDRVYSAMRAGQRGRAIAELEGWVRSHPHDADAMLSLARLLNEAGRVDRSVALYRRALAAEGGRE
jgi:hypothetical protein